MSNLGSSSHGFVSVWVSFSGRSRKSIACVAAEKMANGEEVDKVASETRPMFIQLQSKSHEKMVKSHESAYIHLLFAIIRDDFHFWIPQDSYIYFQLFPLV